MSMYKDVVTFIEACDQKPTIDSVNLYTRLIEEEYNEFLVARHQAVAQRHVHALPNAKDVGRSLGTEGRGKVFQSLELRSLRRRRVARDERCVVCRLALRDALARSGVLVHLLQQRGEALPHARTPLSLRAIHAAGAEAELEQRQNEVARASAELRQVQPRRQEGPLRGALDAGHLQASTGQQSSSIDHQTMVRGPRLSSE